MGRKRERRHKPSFLFFSQLLLILHFSCSTSSTTPSHHTSRLLQKRTHSFYLHTRDEGLASPALIYLEVAVDEAGFHFIIAFDKIDDELYIIYCRCYYYIRYRKTKSIYTTKHTEPVNAILLGTLTKKTKEPGERAEQKVITSDTSDCFLPKNHSPPSKSPTHMKSPTKMKMQSPICQFLNTKLLCCLRVNDRDMGSFFPRTLALQRGAPLQSQSVALWFCQMLCYSVTHHIPVERQYC